MPEITYTKKTKVRINVSSTVKNSSYDLKNKGSVRTLKETNKHD